MTVDKFIKMLENHDWWSDMSDDHSVWQRGRDEYARINDIACSDPKLAEVFSAWMDYRNMERSRPTAEEFE